MRNIFSGGRLLAATAAAIAFVGTFAVSARAVMQEEATKLVYVVISVNSNSNYWIGQKVDVPRDRNGEQYVQIADGVWAQLVPDSEEA